MSILVARAPEPPAVDELGPLLVQTLPENIRRAVIRGMLFTGVTCLTAAIILVAPHPDPRLYGIVAAVPLTLYVVASTRRSYIGVGTNWLIKRVGVTAPPYLMRQEDIKDVSVATGTVSSIVVRDEFGEKCRLPMSSAPSAAPMQKAFADLLLNSSASISPPAREQLRSWAHR